MVIALAERGGVIQISFGSTFVSQATVDYNAARTAAANEYRLANHLEPDDPALRSFLTTYREANPYPYATLDQVLDHFDRVIEIAGVARERGRWWGSHLACISKTVGHAAFCDEA